MHQYQEELAVWVLQHRAQFCVDQTRSQIRMFSAAVALKTTIFEHVVEKYSFVYFNCFNYFRLNSTVESLAEH